MRQRFTPCIVYATISNIVRPKQPSSLELFNTIIVRVTHKVDAFLLHRAGCQGTRWHRVIWHWWGERPVECHREVYARPGINALLSSWLRAKRFGKYSYGYFRYQWAACAVCRGVVKRTSLQVGFRGWWIWWRCNGCDEGDAAIVAKRCAGSICHLCWPHYHVTYVKILPGKKKYIYIYIYIFIYLFLSVLTHTQGQIILKTRYAKQYFATPPTICFICVDSA